MAIDSVNTLVKLLGQYRLLDAIQLDELTRELQPKFSDPLQLSRELVQRGWLTPYQVNQLFQAKDQRLVLGSYILLEKISEGPMGDVFKARHQHMKRVVSLQVIRPELLQKPEILERFYQEVQAASQLSYLHLVGSFDAGPIGNTHFFAMEYIEGIDLERHIQQDGALPLIRACEYIRQAALGLQHAFQRGLRHHDLTPANLLLVETRASKADGSSAGLSSSSAGNLTWGLVKIRNMGLTVIRQPTKHTRLAASRAREGTGVNSPDFTAPERIATGQLCDGRSELYSLGCIFYYLLTCEVPFPGGSAADKQRRHQQEAPAPLESLRPDLPPEVCGIVNKLMAKRPDDRYQTPAELMAALAAIPAHVLTASLTEGKQWQKRLEADKQRTRRLMMIGGGVLAGGLCLFLLLLFVTSRGSGSTEGKAVPVAARLVVASRPSLDVQCGRADGLPPTTVLYPGYGYRFHQGENGGGWAQPNGQKLFCWYHAQQIIFDVQVPTRTPGELRLSFWDADNLKRMQSVKVEKKSPHGVDNFSAFPGKRVDVSVTDYDTRDGKIAVTITNTPPSPNAVLSRLEFFPYINPDDPPPAPSGPALVIQCGRVNRVPQEDVLLQGYAYKLLQGAPVDNWGSPAAKPHRWEEGNEVRFELNVPAGTAGKLRLLCLDPDNQMRKSQIIVQGKERGEVSGMGPAGKWFDTALSSADTKDGRVEVKVKKTGGPNATVTTVEFTPQK